MAALAPDSPPIGTDDKRDYKHNQPYHVEDAEDSHRDGIAVRNRNVSAK
jgi:hypothetical protein